MKIYSLQFHINALWIMKRSHFIVMMLEGEKNTNNVYVFMSITVSSQYFVDYDNFQMTRNWASYLISHKSTIYMSNFNWQLHRICYFPLLPQTTQLHNRIFDMFKLFSFNSISTCPINCERTMVW